MNKKMKGCLIFLLLMFITIGAVSATEVSDDNTVVADETPTTYSTEEAISYETSASSDNSPNIRTTINDNSVVTVGDNEIIDGNGSTFTNTSFKVTGNNVVLSNFCVDNNDFASSVIDATGVNNLTIANVCLTTTNTDGITFGIDFTNTTNSIIRDSIITVNAPSQTQIWNNDTGYWYSTLPVSAILMDGSQNIQVTGNTISITNTTESYSGTTMPAVTIKNNAQDILVENNSITSNGASYVYGIMMNDNVANIIVNNNNVTVTGPLYVAGIDASTASNSRVSDNRIIATSSNPTGNYGAGEESLAYGVILATYNTGNNNNTVSANTIDLTANVAYAIENVYGTENNINNNIITINAKRGLGIATHTSNSNHYDNNNITINCNQDTINTFYEMIQAQNVGIIILNSSGNQINNNIIKINVTGTIDIIYAIKLDENSTYNTGSNNDLTVFNSSETKLGIDVILDEGNRNTVEVIYNSPNRILSKIYSNNLKSDEGNIEWVVVDKNSIKGENNTGHTLQDDVDLTFDDNAYVLFDLKDTDIRSIFIRSNSLTMKIINAENFYGITLNRGTATLVDSVLPAAVLTPKGCVCRVVNCTFLDLNDSNIVIKNKGSLTLENTTFIAGNDVNQTLSFTTGDSRAQNTKVYSDYFDTTTNLLLSSVNPNINLIFRDFPFEQVGEYHQYISQSMIINQPINLTTFDNAPWIGDITFITGSEGSNITNMILNGTVYINTTDIGLYNNTINKGVVLTDSANTNIQDNTFNTEATAITLTNTLSTSIQNNQINSQADYAITLDASSIQNTITENVIYSVGKEGDDAVSGDTSTNTITANKPGPVNYYVSDETGSDDNDGSQSAPFKTIGAAITKADDTSVFNIYILEGTYKGQGNTNLTVPGDYRINFIGSGINKTVIDGDANFTIPNQGNEAWGGSAFWNNWNNCSGNWFMNITSSEGIFIISNMTIQNCWSNSGSSIAACPTATIDNRATLTVTDIYFNKNHAGNGAGIRNIAGGTLYVDNCIFENGTKAQTTGNFGAAIYNNGTAIVTNTQIINNYARWGSVTNDKNITMINCTFRDNHAYDGGSGYKYGSSFFSGTGVADFFRSYPSVDLSSTIINCTFQDNGQCDIADARGDLVVDNCIFNHSVGIYLFPNTNRYNTYTPTQNITNNQFIDMQPSTQFATLISSTTPSVAVRSVAPYPLRIENNIIDVKDTVNGYGLYITSNATVVNNTMNNYIYVNNRDNVIDHNVIETTKENTVLLTNNAKNVTITNNELYGGYVDGDLSIGNVLSDTIVETNIPESVTYTINNDNYATYFDENGVLRTSLVNNGSLITFVDDLTNKDFVFDNVKVAVNVNTTLYNTTIITQNNARVLLNNLKIDNAKTDEDYVILFESEGNTIKNGNINVTTDKPVQIIKVEEDGNIITGTIINATIPAADVIWNSGYTIGNVPSAGIFIRSSYNKVNNTKLYIYSTTNATGSEYPTVDGIDIQSKLVGEFVVGNEIKNTRINVTGGSYVYGLNIARAKETTTPTSYYDVTSTNYAVGIQIGDSDNNNISGYVYSKADNMAYGYYSTGMASGITNNTNVSKLYLQSVEAPNAIGIGIEGASNVELSSATYNIYGENVMAIDIAPDYMGKKPENINIYSLTINLNGESDESGMIYVTNSSNVNINKSYIKSKSGNGIVLEETSSSSVTNNYINAANLVGGDDAVYTSDATNIVFNNTPKIGVLTDETYSDFFDENNTLYVDVGVITLGGDLHNKILRFADHTKVINITNADDYTMYNSTVVIAGNGTYGDRFGFTVENINFNNTNTPVFIDEFDGTGQKNVKFVNDNIYVTGEDIVAFDALNNKSYVYLDISNTNILMEGQNIIAVNYAGYNRGQPGYVSKNNITLVASNKATVFNAEKATIQFNNNNVTVIAKEAVVANLFNTTISYYNFDENRINVIADNPMILNMTKGDTSSAYISDNEINVLSGNPATLINITGTRTVYVQGNKIMLYAVNGETPVISVNVPSSYVRNNYILANDMRGNNAVEDTGITISGNTPGDVITDDTYYDFFDSDGVLIPLFTNNELIVSGEFRDNNVFIFDAVNVTLKSDGTAVFYDGQMWTGLGSTVTFDGLVFNNTVDAFVLESQGNVIKNTTLYIDSDDEIHAIYVYDDNNVIQDSFISITAPSANVIYNPDYSVNTPAPAAVVISSDNNIIDNTIIIFDGTEAIHDLDPEAWDAPTVDGIYLVSSTEAILNNTIRNSSVNVVGSYYAYGINVGNAKDTLLEDVYVDVMSDYYADAIQLFDADTITINGEANAQAETEAYGLYSTAMGMGYSKNIDLTGLSINVEAPLATGVLIEGSSNVTMQDAAYNIEGDEATAVKAYIDFMGNIPSNIVVDNIDINVDGTDDNPVLYFGKADAVSITNNDIVSTSGSEIVFNETPNSQVTDNYIKINDVIFGNYAVITTENDTVIANNTPTSKLMEDMQQTIDELQKEIEELKAAKNTTIMLDEITDARYKENVTISGTLVNEDSIGLYNQIITLTIGDVEVNVTTKGGIFTYTTVFNEVGEKTVTASYAGSDKYRASEATMTFNVEKQDVTITYDPIEDVKYKDNITVTGKITDVNGYGLGNVNARIGINGKLYKAKTDRTGAFTFTIAAATVGTNNVTISYAGNNYYNTYKTTTTFNVEKQDITITYDAIEDVKYKDNIIINGRIADANGNGLGNVNALIHVNGVLYKAKTDSAGAFTLTIAANKTGTNKLKLSYGGNANYNSYTTNTTFNVEKQDITITYTPITDVECGENVTITGKVIDANEKGLGNINALIRINGKLYKAKTDKTGAFTFTTTVTTVGVNNVTLSYGGNDNYNSYETDTTFNVIAKAE